MTTRLLVPLAGICAVFWAQFAWVRATNFQGFDEWLEISLLSKGIIAFPYAGRPFVLLWHLPAAMLAPNRLGAYLFVHSTYLMLSGCLVFLICRRLLPSAPLVAFLAGTFSAIWAPLDRLRLSTPVFVGYSGPTCGALFALWLFVEAWRRQSVVLLAAGGLVGFVTARGFEGVLPLLLAAPLLLLHQVSLQPRRFWAWAGAWEAGALLATGLAAWPLVAPGSATSYQASMASIDLNPIGIAARLLRQYAYHLLPLASSHLGELLVAAVPIAVLVFGLLGLAVVRVLPALPEGSGARRSLALAMLAGLVAAGLGYSALVLSPRMQNPTRTQFLSAPGIAVLLAAGIGLLATGLPRRCRGAAVLLLGGWVVAVGTGRTLAMQRDWDRSSAYPVQSHSLRGVTRLTPNLKPHTLILLLDEKQAWVATFNFRHAVEYLYRGRATGYVWGAWEIFYPAAFGPDGLRCEPWPVIRGPWDSPISVHRYDEIVAMRQTAQGELMLLDEWPDAFPPLPEGARYDPGARLLPAAGAPAEWSVLEP